MGLCYFLKENPTSLLAEKKLDALKFLIGGEKLFALF